MACPDNGPQLHEIHRGRHPGGELRRRGPAVPGPGSPIRVGATSEGCGQRRRLPRQGPARRVLDYLGRRAWQLARADYGPRGAAKGKPLPLVIALHGAGGSENMFFDAYGNGKIVDLCRKRGWLLVAPRLSFFGLGMPVDSIDCRDRAALSRGQTANLRRRPLDGRGRRPSTSCNRLAIPLRLSLL